MAIFNIVSKELEGELQIPLKSSNIEIKSSNNTIKSSQLYYTESQL